MGRGQRMAGARFEICHARGADAARGGYLWRLLSSNNIEVGRATVAFGDLELPAPDPTRGARDRIVGCHRRRARPMDLEDA